jgi:hypothetical protein
VEDWNFFLKILLKIISVKSGLFRGLKLGHSLFDNNISGALMLKQVDAILAKDF